MLQSRKQKQIVCMQTSGLMLFVEQLFCYVTSATKAQALATLINILSFQQRMIDDKIVNYIDRTLYPLIVEQFPLVANVREDDLMSLLCALTVWFEHIGIDQNRFNYMSLCEYDETTNDIAILLED